MAARKTSPPTTPPAIAPVFEEPPDEGDDVPVLDTPVCVDCRFVAVDSGAVTIKKSVMRHLKSATYFGNPKMEIGSLTFVIDSD